MKSGLISFMGLVATIFLGVQALNVPIPACMTKCLTQVEIFCNPVTVLDCAEKSCDMQDLRSAELLALEICGIFGIPPPLNLSTTTNSTLTPSSAVTLSTFSSSKTPSLSSSHTPTTQITVAPGHQAPSTPTSSTTENTTLRPTSTIAPLTWAFATAMSTLAPPSAGASISVTPPLQISDSTTTSAPSSTATSGSDAPNSTTTSTASQADLSSRLSVRAGVGIGAAAGTVAICLALLAWFLYLRRCKRRVLATRHVDQFAAAPRRPWQSDERGWTLFSDHDHTELEDGAVGGIGEELPPYYMDGPFVALASSTNSLRVPDPFASIPRRDSVQAVFMPEKPHGGLTGEIVSTSGGSADGREDGTGGGAPISSGYGVA